MVSEDVKTSLGEEPGRTHILKGSGKTDEMTKAKNGNEYRVEATSDPVTAESDAVRLTKQIGMFSGATIIIGNIVGSGIFLTPGGVLKNTGSLGMSMVVWVVSGLFSLVDLSILYNILESLRHHNHLNPWSLSDHPRTP